MKMAQQFQSQGGCRKCLYRRKMLRKLEGPCVDGSEEKNLWADVFQLIWMDMSALSTVAETWCWWDQGPGLNGHTAQPVLLNSTGQAVALKPLRHFTFHTSLWEVTNEKDRGCGWSQVNPSPQHGKECQAQAVLTEGQGSHFNTQWRSLFFF